MKAEKREKKTEEKNESGKIRTKDESEKKSIKTEEREEENGNIRKRSQNRQKGKSTKKAREGEVLKRRMKYITGYLWEQGSDSVLLQQVKAGRARMVLGWIADEGETGAMLTGQVKAWFEEDGIQLCRKGREESLTESLHHQLQNARASKAAYAGVILQGEAFWMFQKGEVKLWALNSRFQRSYMREMTERIRKEGERGILTGRIQKGVGILLGTGRLCETLQKEEIRECLAVSDIRADDQLKRRLKELDKLAIDRKKEEGQEERGSSAIYIKTM